jgi:hypothetical protein
MQEYRKKRAKLTIPNDQKERRLLLELEFDIDESVGLIKNFILTPAGYSFPVVGEERNRKSDASQPPLPLRISHILTEIRSGSRINSLLKLGELQQIPRFCSKHNLPREIAKQDLSEFKISPMGYKS